MPLKKRVHGAGADRFAAMMKALYQVRIEGRPIVELFLEIPDANMYPDYQRIVSHPISLAEIGKRVKSGSYASEDALIADFERMADNARAYNGEESPVVDDAVDILDFVLLYLGREPSAHSRKQLQLQILNDLENYKSKGRRLSDAFMVEPDAKTYPKYREIVKTPSSFETVRNHIENEGPYENWAEATQEIGLMFQNAMLFNQEGSVIYNDAKTLLKQLDAKVNKYSQTPRHLELALPGNKSKKTKREGSVETSGADDDANSEEEENSNEGEDEDENDFDEDEGDSDEDERPTADVGRYEDDDDDDFEADSEDVDEEDLANNGEGSGENGNGEENGGAGQNGGEMVPIGIDPANVPPAFMQPSHVFDEIVYRPPDEGLDQALLKLVTCQSTPIPPHMAPIDDVKRSENDVLQLRFPPSPTKAFMTFATTLPYYQSSLRLSVFPNRDINPLQVAVMLNGAKLIPTTPPPNLPPSVPPSDHEAFEITLAPGLNQISVIAIKSTYGGFMRQYGPPPLAEAEPDEERMVLFLNLSK